MRGTVIGGDDCLGLSGEIIEESTGGTYLLLEFPSPVPYGHSGFGETRGKHRHCRYIPKEFVDTTTERFNQMIDEYYKISD